MSNPQSLIYQTATGALEVQLDELERISVVAKIATTKDFLVVRRNANNRGFLVSSIRGQPSG